MPILGLYGFVYKASPDKKIFLCDQYDKSEIIPNEIAQYDTKMGVIIHEASHKAIDSEDHFYMHNTYKTYAKACSYNNIENADCIQIYAELNFYENMNQITDL